MIRPGARMNRHRPESKAGVDGGDGVLLKIPRRRRTFVAFATFGLLSVALACGGPKHPNCENDEHCNAEGHSGVCLNGKCVDCRDDAGCGRGKECRAGTCAVIEGFCDDKLTCPGGSPCQNGRCQSSKVASREPRECGDDLPACH